ncbi:uncharacterized protein LOC124699419 [Lolium rigidum]|uniref:uncharacterized protein LOC124699419 n=1 Tax=Lolium rigidum TaxID=89674 RepID=UPI001F5CFAB6|nr:uncharacterized protein LOC124699419 [Lolium rigidum]
MIRRHVLYYDLIWMTEEVGFHAVDFLYYEKKDPQHNSYLAHIDDQSFVVKMLSDPGIEKTVHLHVPKEKYSDDIASRSNQNDIAPSNYPNGRALLLDGGVSTEGAEQLTVRRPQRRLRRAKRLNVIEIADQLDDEDGDFSNGQKNIAPSDESQAIEDEEGRFHNQGKGKAHKSIFCKTREAGDKKINVT